MPTTAMPVGDRILTPATSHNPPMSASSSWSQDPTRARQRTGLDINDPLFKHLLAGVDHSATLLVGYCCIVALFLGLAIAIRGYGRLKSHYTKRSRCDKIHLWKSCPSSSPTPPRSPNTSPALDNSEKARLLQTTTVTSPRSCRFRFTDMLASWLMYQPQTRFLGRDLPPNGHTLLICFFFGVNVYYLLRDIELTMPTLFILADRAGALFSRNLPFLYIISAKNQPLQSLLGQSYADLNLLHRRLGDWMCFLAGMHCTLMVTVWATLMWPRGYTFSRFINDRVTIFGLCTALTYTIIFTTSMRRVREAAYRLFVVSHVLLQVAGLVFLYFHHSKTRPFVLACLTIWTCDRIVWRMLLRSKCRIASIAVMDDGDTVSLRIPLPDVRKSAWRSLLGASTIFNGWRASDHVFLSSTQLGLAHLGQAHPFTVASSSNSITLDSVDLSFIIRAKSGFSRALLEYAKRNKSIRVQLDGPYGVRTANSILNGCQNRILIAGGSGISVTWPLAQALLESENTARLDSEVGAEISRARPVIFIWIVREADQYYWLEQAQLAQLKASRVIHVVLPTPTSVAGRRPNMSELLADCLAKFGTDSGDGDGDGGIGVVCSGPDSMARDVRNACAALVGRGTPCSLHVEKYRW